MFLLTYIQFCRTFPILLFSGVILEWKLWQKGKRFADAFETTTTVYVGRTWINHNWVIGKIISKGNTMEAEYMVSPRNYKCKTMSLYTQYNVTNGGQSLIDLK